VKVKNRNTKNAFEANANIRNEKLCHTRFQLLKRSTDKEERALSKLFAKPLKDKEKKSKELNEREQAHHHS
jgi:hypothetical protein